MRTFGICGARPVKDRDVADALHQGAAAALRETRHECLAGGAVPAGGLHLDEFVIVQRARRLAHDRLGEAGIAHADDRLQGVGESAQVPFLALAQLRGGGRGGPGIGFAHARHCRSAELVLHRRRLIWSQYAKARERGARAPDRERRLPLPCRVGVQFVHEGLCAGVLCDQASKPARGDLIEHRAGHPAGANSRGGWLGTS